MEQKIIRKPVESSHIKSIGYDGPSSTLEIEFKTGSIWSYQPITQEGWEEFLKSESKGAFFHEKIKHNTAITATRIFN